MGRNAYLYLLTLGRYCYEPQNPAASLAGASSAPSASTSTRPAQQSISSDPTSSTSGVTSAGEAGPTTTVATTTTTTAEPYEHASRGLLNAQSSIELQRSLRKAQNDVLTTIGMQLHKGGRGQEKSRAERKAMEESEDDTGLLLSGVDMAILYFSTWPLISLRNEFQTFAGIEGLGFVEIVRLVVRERSVMEWFSGAPCNLVYQVIHILRDYFTTQLFKRLEKWDMFKDPETGKPNRWRLNMVYKGLAISTFILTYPIYQHSVQQSLHMLPPTPILPSLSTLNPFSLLPNPFTLSNVVKVLITPSTYLLSPYFWSFLQQKAHFSLQLFFLNYLHKRLPRVDAYKEIRISGSVFAPDGDYDGWFTDDEDTRTVVNGVDPYNTPSARAAARNNRLPPPPSEDAPGINGVLGDNDPVINGGVEGVSITDLQMGTMLGSDEDDESAGIIGAAAHHHHHHQHEATHTFTATITPETPGHSPILERHDSSGLQRMPISMNDSSFLDPHDLEDVRSTGAISEIEVQVTTSMHPSPDLIPLDHHGDHQELENGDFNSTFHGNGVGVNGTSAGGPGGSNERRRRRNRDTRRYRTTNLSTNPMEVLSSHLAEVASTTLTLGLESLVWRTNASAVFYRAGGVDGAVPLPRSNLLVLANNAGMLGLSGSRGLLGPDVLTSRGMRTTGREQMVLRVSEGVGANWGLIWKALVGEWVMNWGLFEVSFWVTRWVGIRFFGYGGVYR